MPRHVLSMLCLVACTGSTTTTDVSATGDTSTGVEWSFAAPTLTVNTLEVGGSLALTVERAPAGAEVVFYMSEVGLQEEPCGPANVLCVGLVDGAELGRADASFEGVAVLAGSTVTEPARELFFRATVRDRLTGAQVWTDAVARPVLLDGADSPVNFFKRGSSIGITAYTAGNTHTGGTAWIDYNNDLWPDLFISNGGNLPHYLFRNDGDGSFTNVSDLVPKPAANAVEDAGVFFADIDNDGDSDLFLPGDAASPLDPAVAQPRPGGPNQLYLNNGDGTFAEVAASAGVLDPEGDRNSTAAFADFDRDGFVDLYVGQWTIKNEPLGTHDDYDKLLHNEGDGTFRDVSAEVGFSNGLDALVGVWIDPDMDSWPDLYIGNISHEYDPPEQIPDDVFFHNDGGTFSDGLVDMPHVGDDAWAAMGITQGDLDNDGDWDLYITDWWTADPLPYGNVLYLGNGDGTFSENSCREANVCSGYTTWPTSFVDFDNDGWLDLYVGTNLSGTPDMLYINQTDGTFVPYRVTGVQGNATRGGAAADYDGDGDVDLSVWLQDDDSRILRNDNRRTELHHLSVKLYGNGTTSNRDAIGAWVRMTTPDGRENLRMVSGGDSAHSQSELILHFGAGEATTVDLEIHWPSGTVTTLDDLPVDDLYLVEEDEGVLAEELVYHEVRWSQSSKQMSALARTNRGGRTGLLGGGVPLNWNPDEAAWTGFRSIPTQPATLELTSIRGGSWTVPVTVVP